MSGNLQPNVSGHDDIGRLKRGDVEVLFNHCKELCQISQKLQLERGPPPRSRAATPPEFEEVPFPPAMAWSEHLRLYELAFERITNRGSLNANLHPGPNAEELLRMGRYFRTCQFEMLERIGLYGVKYLGESCIIWLKVCQEEFRKVAGSGEEERHRWWTRHEDLVLELNKLRANAVPALRGALQRDDSEHLRQVLGWWREPIEQLSSAVELAFTQFINGNTVPVRYKFVVLSK